MTNTKQLTWGGVRWSDFLGRGTSLSKYVVARVAALPADVLRCQSTSELRHAWSAIARLTRDIRSSRDIVSADLFDFIGTVPDREHRGRLIELRRRMYNDRLDTSSNGLVDTLPRDIGGNIGALVRARRERDSLNQAFCAGFHEALLNERELLLNTAHEPNFCTGLALASPTLFAAFQRMRDDPTAMSSRRRDQALSSLLQYVSRTSRKATPFGRFCSILPARIHVGESGEYIRLAGRLTARVVVPTLNKFLFFSLWTHLLDRPAVLERVEVRLNPTARRRGESWAFLGDGRGIDLLQDLRNNAALELITKLIPPGGCRVQDLLDAVCSSGLVDADRSSASGFVSHLRKIGFLQSSMPVATSESEWETPFAEWLAALDDEHAVLVRQMCDTLRALKRELVQADAVRTAGVLEDIRRCIEATHASVGIAVSTTMRSWVFEDLTADCTLDAAFNSEASSALAVIGRLGSLVHACASGRVEKIRLAEFFRRTYPSDARIPLLDFYEAYWRDQLARKASGEPGPEIDAASRTQEATAYAAKARGHLRDIIGLRWNENPAAEEVHVDLRELEEAIGDSPARQSEQPLSWASYCQLFESPTAPGRVHAVLPGRGFLSGFGKQLSRFLGMLPDKWQAAALEQNVDLFDGVLAEVVADMGFTANLHPPLAPAEIEYPTSSVDSKPGRYSCSDLRVWYDDRSEVLKLGISQSNREVIPLDLSLLTLSARPRLYQLLTLFSPTAYGSIPLPDRCCVGPLPRVEYRPRIVVDGSVVVARRSWWINVGSLPDCDGDDAAVCLAMNAWRDEHGIPCDVYAMVARSENPLHRPARDGENQEEKVRDPDANHPDAPSQRPSPRTTRPDDHKPQFIDFLSPIHVSLVRRLIRLNKQHRVRFEESFPNTESLVSHEGHPYVSEWIVQFYRVPAAADAVIDGASDSSSH